MLEQKSHAPLETAIAQERGQEERFGYRLPGGPAKLGLEETR
jgi:NADH-quinone oxidoreductase subunit B